MNWTRAQLVEMADTAASRWNVPTDLFRALIQTESGFDPYAIGSVGEVGLGQLTWDTSRAVGVRDRFDPEQNLDGAARYLGHHLEQFQNERYAVAAYNAGPHRIVQYKGVPPFEVTKKYVERIMSRMGRPYRETKTEVS